MLQKKTQRIIGNDEHFVGSFYGSFLPAFSFRVNKDGSVRKIKILQSYQKGNFNHTVLKSW